MQNVFPSLDHGDTVSKNVTPTFSEGKPVLECAASTSNLIPFEAIVACETFSLNKVCETVESQRTMLETNGSATKRVKTSDTESLGNTFDSELEKVGIYENAVGPIMPECVECEDRVGLKVCQILAPFSRYIF